MEAVERCKMSKTYKRNFIHRVIFRLDFNSVKDDFWVSKSEAIEKYLSDKEFNVQSNELTAFVTEISPVSHAVKSVKMKEYILVGDNGTFKITKDSWSFETSKYVSFEKIKEVVAKIVPGLLRELGIELIKRLGLRYINTIDLDLVGKDYKECFSKNVTSFLDGYEISDDMLRTMQSTIFKKNDFYLTYNYGIFNSNYPNPITKKEFALDLDASLVNVNINDVFDSFIKAHDEVIQVEFENSITDVFRGILDE